MSQSEVEDFLQKNKKGWFTVRQISERLGITNSSCTKNIHALFKHNLIRRREHGKRYTFEYGYKE